MKTLRSKIKKAAFGMIAALLAIGFSAFTPVESENNLLAFRYVNQGGKYVLNQTANPTGNCTSAGTIHCVIETDEDMGTDFEYGDLEDIDWEPLAGSQQGAYTGP